MKIRAKSLMLAFVLKRLEEVGLEANGGLIELTL